MTATVISDSYLIFARGRKMRRDGLPCPPKANEELDPHAQSPEAILWMGYRIEMWAEWDERKKVAEMLGMPEPEWRE